MTFSGQLCFKYSLSISTRWGHRISFIAQVSNDFISQLLAHAIDGGTKAAVYRGLPRQEAGRNKDWNLTRWKRMVVLETS